jgi:hypothetical protein
MSALSNLTQTTGSSTTTLPAWYSTAQQNLVNGATQAAAAAPQLGQTVAQGAINTLSGPNNPFTTSTGTLNSIAAGAANPWITDPNTGAVTPNTNTALGGLFQAQKTQLEGEMPYIQAGAAAPSIGSGNFGSLRGQVATDIAMGDAENKLFTSQQQAALNNQQTGVAAATGAGTVGQQGINAAMNVGQEQMAAPFTSQANLGNILASINAPSTVNTTQTPSNLAALTGLGTATAGGLNALFASGTPGTSGYSAGLLDNISKAGSGLSKLFGGNTNPASPALPAGTGTDAGNATTDYSTTPNPAQSNGGLADNTLVYNPNSPTNYADANGNFVNSDGSPYGGE